MVSIKCDRYTDRGGTVLRTDAAVDTTVFHLALKLEHTLVEVVPDLGKVGLMRKILGFWYESRRSEARRVMVWKDTRPINIPHNHLPQSGAASVASREPQPAPHGISHERQVAATAAEKIARQQR
ncbi:unnamed protein product, partial [Ectocarpus sp. 12 AP-2014]